MEYEEGIKLFRHWKRAETLPTRLEVPVLRYARKRGSVRPDENGLAFYEHRAALG